MKFKNNEVENITEKYIYSLIDEQANYPLTSEEFDYIQFLVSGAIAVLKNIKKKIEEDTQE